MVRVYEVVSTDAYHDSPYRDIPRRAVWEGFKGNTTAHGIPHVNNARGPFKVSIWLVLSLASFGGFCYNAFLLGDKYFSYPSKVSVTVEHKTNMTFPAVTVCNNNPVLLSKIYCSDILSEALGISGTCSSDSDATPAGTRKRRDVPSPPLEEASPPEGDGTIDGGGEKGEPTGEFDGTTYNRDGRPQRATFEAMQEVQQILTDMSLDEKVPLGQTIDSLILDCEFKGATCNTSTDFTSFYNSKYGNCYTFNSGWDPDVDLEYSFRPGPIYGLSLVFNVQQSEYVGTLAESAGVVVVVHPQEKMPFPEDEGIALSPGQRSYIAVSMLSITRAPHPWGECVKVTEKNFTRNVYEEKYGTNYSSNACYKTCYQRHMIEKCGCGDSRFPIYGAAFGYTNVSSCDTSNTTQGVCMGDLETRYALGTLGCANECPEPCAESVYSATVSSNLWPSDAYEDTLYAGLEATNDDVTTLSEEEKKANIGKLTVFLQEFNYESIVESEGYSPFSFISDIGGILGLYIGFSLLSIMEFVELGFDLAILSFLKQKSSRRQQPNQKVLPSSEQDLYGVVSNSPPPHKPTWSPGKDSMELRPSAMTPVGD